MEYLRCKCTQENGGGGGRCAQTGPKTFQWTGHPLKLPSPTKLARLGHFPPARQAGRLAGPVFYVYVFSLITTLLAETWVSRWGGGGSRSSLPLLYALNSGYTDKKEKKIFLIEGNSEWSSSKVIYD